MLFLNSQSVKNKKDKLELYLKSFEKLPILCLCETWLKYDDTNTYLPCANDYTIFRSDRIAGWGGVAILIPKPISTKFCQSINCDEFEGLFCAIKSKQVTLNIGILYRPPRPHKNEMPYKLIDYIEKSINSKEPTIILGDFNYREINWSLALASKQNGQDVFMDFMHLNGFTQIVNFPTRKENYLDLIFVNEYNLLQNVGLGQKISDHESVTATLNFQHIERVNVSYFDFRQSNFNAIMHELSKINWITFFENLTVDSQWNKLVSLLNELVKLYVPLRSVTTKNSQSIGSFKVRKLARKAYNLHKKWKSTNSQATYEKYLVASKLAQRAKHTSDYEKERNILKSGNLNKFWGYIRSKLTYKSSIPCLIDSESNVLLDNPKDKAECLNRYFCSVYVKDDGKLHSWLIDRSNGNHTCESVDFSPEIVFKKLKKISPKFSSGPDGLNSFFMKSLREVLGKPLSHIFQNSMSQSVIPTQWKLANVTAIFKKGEPNLCKNYRPISLTCVASRICESIIADKIKEHIEDKIYSGQHGFRSKRSTVTQLFETYEDWVRLIDSGKCIDVIYIDFAKAFDMVIHNKLVNKLKYYGIQGELLSWIEQFLSNRKQRVILDNQLSATGDVISGVPQGSVLGPLLFLIYINDLYAQLEGLCEIKLFADDCKLYLGFDTKNQLINTRALQVALNKLSVWADNSQLSIQPDKCAVLYLGYGNEKQSYFLRDKIIPEVSNFKDLGVNMSSNLQFHVHISKIVQSASRAASLIMRTFKCKKPVFMVKMFNTFIRSKLEYASSIWNPHSKILINQIENVQRKFTKRLPGLWNKSYVERLKILNLCTLEERRLRLDLIFLYKILKGEIIIDTEKYFDFKTTRTRGHSMALREKNSKKDIKKFSFAQRIVKVWNYLPEDTVSARTVNSFKTKLRNIDLTKFLRGGEPRGHN